MKRIGDVIRTISIPINTNTGATSTAPAVVKCGICQDAGFLRVDVPPGHPNFGRIFPCDCKVREREERAIEDLRRLSNLDAFLDHTFQSFDRSVAGVDEAYLEALKYARNPRSEERRVGKECRSRWSPYH